jgi:hypothetical protein
MLVASLSVALASGVAVAQDGTKRAEPMIGRPRTEVAGTYWDRYRLIAVGGGFIDEGASTADLLLYDVDTRKWIRGPDLPGNRDHAAFAVLDGALYLVGGFTTGLRGATAEVWRLTAPDGTWSDVASMGTARGALGAVAVDGRILAVGGVDDEGRDLASTEWYDASADRWTPGPALSRTRQHVGVATRGRTVYAIGGRSPNLATVERVRFERGAPAGDWQSAPPLQFGRSGNGAATAHGLVCTAGGEEDLGTIAPIECLRAGRWRHVADLAVPRHGLAVVAVGSDLHVISGGPEPGFAFSVAHEVLRVPARR